ncbi:MAG: hypothetical protein OXE04_05790 [bacterium]|nr:hypothetical protein [bacterium]
MVLVPTDTAGIEVVVNAGVGQDNMEDDDHAYLRYNDVRVPAENLLGEEGSGFKIAPLWASWTAQPKSTKTPSPSKY